MFNLTPFPGKAKIGHFGVWAIRKTLEMERRYTRENMNTTQGCNNSKEVQVPDERDIVTVTV